MPARSPAPEPGRGWLSAELHDVLGFRLTVVALHAAAAERSVDSPDGLKESLRLLRESATQALGELRAIVARLDRGGPVPGEDANLDDLEALVRTAREAGLRLDVEQDTAPADLEPEVSEAAIRIVREALTNALRHGDAARGRVALAAKRDALTVEVVDNGTGPAGGRRRGRLGGGAGGRGLRGLADRVHELSGEIEFGPERGGGFKVWARLPRTTATARAWPFES